MMDKILHPNINLWHNARHIEADSDNGRHHVTALRRAGKNSKGGYRGSYWVLNAYRRIGSPYPTALERVSIIDGVAIPAAMRLKGDVLQLLRKIPSFSISTTNITHYGKD